MQTTPGSLITVGLAKVVQLDVVATKCVSLVSMVTV